MEIINFTKFLIILIVFVRPDVSIGSEQIQIKKSVLAGICQSLAAKQIYECEINVGESVEFNPIGSGCSAKFKLGLETKKDDRSFYLVEAQSNFSINNGQIQKKIQNLFLIDSSQRSEVYSALATICAKAQNGSGRDATKNGSSK